LGEQLEAEELGLIQWPQEQPHHLSALAAHPSTEVLRATLTEQLTEMLILQKNWLGPKPVTLRSLAPPQSTTNLRETGAQHIQNFCGV
jgi:hypothetical protein